MHVSHFPRNYNVPTFTFSIPLININNLTFIDKIDSLEVEGWKLQQDIKKAITIRWQRSVIDAA